VPIPHLRAAEVETRSHWQDPHELRVANWIKPWADGEKIDVGIIGVPLARAAIKQVGANYGPNAVRATQFFFTTYSIDWQVDLADMVVRDLGDIAIPLLDVIRGQEQIYEAARAIFAHEPSFMPIFIGGDHSITRPLIRGLADGRSLENIGVVHFDAHMDAQVLDFCGPHNGTPIRGLLDEDDIGFNGRNLASIGISGFVNAAYYHEYLLNKGATIFTSRDVARRGMDSIIADAYAVAADGTDGVYVTFDIDCIELAYGPGTGASISGGLTAWDALDALYTLGQQEKVVGFDLAELDPLRDFGDSTARLAMKMILSFLAGVKQRSSADVLAAAQTTS
jgi:formiminoglutamase